MQSLVKYFSRTWLHCKFLRFCLGFQIREGSQILHGKIPKASKHRKVMLVKSHNKPLGSISESRLCSSSEYGTSTLGTLIFYFTKQGNLTPSMGSIKPVSETKVLCPRLGGARAKHKTHTFFTPLPKTTMQQLNCNSKDRFIQLIIDYGTSGKKTNK